MRHRWFRRIQTGKVLSDTVHLITEDDVILHPTEEDQVEGHIDHPQVSTQGMQVAKHTGGQPVTHTNLTEGLMVSIFSCVCKSFLQNVLF